MPRSVLLCAIGATLLLAACPGQKTDDGLGPDKGKDPDGVKGQDTSIEYDALQLNGTYFTPAGLDRPLFLLARGKKKLTIDKQRAVLKKAKKEAKVGEATILATLLFEASQKEGSDDKRLALVKEARQVLLDVQAELPDQVDALLLHNVGILSFELGDTAGMIAAFDAAVKKATPDDTHTAERKAYLAYYLVRDGKNAEAAALVEGMEASEKEPEQAYAIAWASWRAGDLPRARGAMLAAVKGWRYPATVPAIKRDTLIFAARAGASVDEAVELAKAYAPLASGDNVLLETLVYMHQAFSLAGRQQDSIGLVDRIFAEVKNLSKPDRAKLVLEQADAARILGDTDGTTRYVTASVDVLAGCGADCDAKTAADTAKIIFGMARLAANLYSTSQDERYYEAAAALYAQYLRVPGITDAKDVEAEAANLKQGHDHIKKNAGVHDKSSLQYVIEPHAPEVLACYDAELQRDRQLGGSLTVNLEVTSKGEVAGASADPPAGEQGLAAVAGCAVEAARGWVFPARTTEGVTRIAVAYTLKPQASK